MVGVWCGKGSISIWGQVKDPNFHIFEGVIYPWGDFGQFKLGVSRSRRGEGGA